MINRFVASLIFLISFVYCPAQDSKIDSLTTLLNAAGQDTSRVKLLYQVSQAWMQRDPARAEVYANDGLSLAGKLNWKRGHAMMLVSLGNVLNDGGDRQGALKVYEQSRILYQSLGDRLGLVTVMNDLGGVYLSSSDYVKATEIFTEVLAIGERLGDANTIGTAYTNLSTIFYTQQDYKKALAYDEKALAQFIKTNDPDKLARCYNYFGNAWMALGDRDKTRYYFNKSMEIYQGIGNLTGVAILLSQIAILYDPDYATIIRYQEKSQAIWDSLNPRHYNSIINLGNMGETWLNFIRADSSNRLSAAQRAACFANASANLQRAIDYSRESKDGDNLSYFTAVLAEMQELKGDYKSALASLRSSTEIRDSLYSQQNKNAIAGLESKRAIEQRDSQLELNRLSLRSQQRQRVALMSGIGLLLVISALIWYQSSTRKRTNTTLLQLNNELDEANKVKAKFFAILSHDLRSPVSNLVSFLEMQQDDPGLLSPEQARTHQQNISASARGLLDTMEAMLLWSKGQMEQFKPNKHAVPVSELFAHLQRFFTDETGVQMTYHGAEGLIVQTDENYLQTIMQNLTANAIKVLKKKPGGSIHWEAQQDGSQVSLSITDNGPGVQEDQLRALYEDNVVVNAKTGLGLHLIRDLASAIQCRISVNSGPATGTTFTLAV